MSAARRRVSDLHLGTDHGRRGRVWRRHGNAAQPACEASRRTGGSEDPLTVTEQARLKELERGNQDLRAETLFLKKSALISHESSGSEQV
jgi:transposase-like protein